MNCALPLLKFTMRILSYLGWSRTTRSGKDCTEVTEDTMIISGGNQLPLGSSSSQLPDGPVANSNPVDTAPNQPPATSQQSRANELTHFHQNARDLLQNNIYVNFRAPTPDMDRERRDLAKHGWYWGPITLSAAQKKCKGRPNGSFLVRDSQSSPYQFSISFRSGGCTLHSRIEYTNGYWTIFADRRYKTMLDLIEDTMRESRQSTLCYVLSSTPLGPDFPIQLRIPVSRFVDSSLQHLCRLFIRSEAEKGQEIEKLPLPPSLILYLQETTFDDL